MQKGGKGCRMGVGRGCGGAERGWLGGKGCRKGVGRG